MKIPISKSQRGFSLLEMLVASSIGLIAIMAMTQLFNMGMNATLTVTQRADTQENMRAGIELMTKDISMAGAGLPSGGLQLATADGASKVACNQAGTCYVTADTYPLSGRIDDEALRAIIGIMVEGEELATKPGGDIHKYVDETLLPGG